MKEDKTLEALAIAIDEMPNSLIDILITCVGVVALAFIIILYLKKEEYENDGEKKPVKRFVMFLTNLYQWGIDACPLLGTFGTVVALIVTTGSSDGEKLKADFMYALTSTLWGILWAVLCRLAESLGGVNGYYETLAEERGIEPKKKKIDTKRPESE